MSRRLQNLQRKQEALEKIIKEEAERDRKRSRARDTRIRVRLGALTMSLLNEDLALRARFKTAAKDYFKHAEARSDLALDEAETWFDALTKHQEDVAAGTNRSEPEPQQVRSQTTVSPTSASSQPTKKLPVAASQHAVPGAQPAPTAPTVASASTPKPAVVLTKAHTPEATTSAPGAP